MVSTRYRTVQMTTRKDLQAELDAYYARSLADARSGLAEHLDTLSAPFLLNIPEAYLNASLRVMFIGKETNGWYGKLRQYYEMPDAIDLLKARYAEQFSRSTGTSAFLRRMMQLATELADGNMSAICWNNLLKMD